MCIFKNNLAKDCAQKAIILLFLLLGATPLKSVEIRRRIAHGNVAQPGQFPWLVIIKAPKLWTVYCGGSLISAEFVLTASHCLYKRSYLRLFFGTSKLSDPEALTMLSQQFYVHPDYNDSSYDNDIGLIRLPLPVEFNNQVKPIKLVPRSMATENFVGTRALIAGFGLVTDEYPNSYPLNANYASVKIISREECQAKFQFALPKNSLCSEGATIANEKICDGDSGGGLISHDSQGTLILIGVNSFGAQKCTRRPSGYVNVVLFLDWIESVTHIHFS